MKHTICQETPKRRLAKRMYHIQYLKFVSYLAIKEKLTTSSFSWLVQSLFPLCYVNYFYDKHYICMNALQRPWFQKGTQQLWWEKTDFLLKCTEIAAPKLSTLCVDRKKDSALWFENLHGMSLTLLEQYSLCGLWDKRTCRWVTES